MVWFIGASGAWGGFPDLGGFDRGSRLTECFILGLMGASGAYTLQKGLIGFTGLIGFVTGLILKHKLDGCLSETSSGDFEVGTLVFGSTAPMQ